MDEEIKKELAAQRQFLQAIYESVEKTRRYLFWTFVITIIVVVLPAIGLVFMIPQFLSTYTDIGGLGL